LESVQTLAGVKLFQHVQEEIAEQPVVCRYREEGLGGIIFWVILEVQIACRNPAGLLQELSISTLARDKLRPTKRLEP
jgi:hypothetical protein